MKYSIRYRFTAILLFIITVMLSAICLLNLFGLEAFYRQQKVERIKEAYSRIDEIIMNESKSNNTKSLNEILQEYSNKYNISIAIIDSITDIALISSERDGELILERIRAGIFGSHDSKDVEILHQTKSFDIRKHYIESIDTSFIECIGYCKDNQTIVVMSTPMDSMRENVELSNRFLIYIGLIAFVVSFSIIFLMTKKITMPILTLASISERMGKLDFEAKYEGDNEDEIGILGHNMNIMSDKLKDTIEKLQNANDKLQQDIRKKEEIDEMRKDFIANVSHELKTPIALIQGYAEGLNEGLCDDVESRKYYLEVIMDEANKMNTIVKQLLTLSAIESGVKQVEYVKFDITELISGVIDSTHILLREKNIELKFDSSKEIYVFGDEFKIEEVVTNYISNAIHHTDIGGSIDIDIIDKQDRIRILVFNTGNNIPSDDIEHIWDKFYKVDKAHSRTYGGTGIGLSIVKAIMEAHKMNCGVENKEDGVEFWFELKKTI